MNLKLVGMFQVPVTSSVEILLTQLLTRSEVLNLTKIQLENEAQDSESEKKGGGSGKPPF